MLFKPKVVFIILFCLSVTYAQQSILSYRVNILSSYIADLNEPKSYKKLDSIFIKSLSISCNNTSEALLAIVFTSVPYKIIKMRLPIINVIGKFPLISADDSTFLLKNKNLPSQFYLDSPKEGDTDKTAHFFGGAFLSNSFQLLDISDLIGKAVELFEEKFYVQSRVDYRDIRTNRIGIIFGKLLKKRNSVLPSHVITAYNFNQLNLSL